MKNLDKNEQLIIGLIQTSGYLLRTITRMDRSANSIQRKDLKKQINQMVAFLKHDAKRLKRV
jgi:hypothetical protein